MQGLAQTLAVLLDTNDVVAEAGDAMDTNAILKSSLDGASKGSGRSEDSEFVCWYERDDVARCRETTTWTVEGFEEERTTKEGAREGSKCKCHECDDFRPGMNSKEANAFDVSKI